MNLNRALCTFSGDDYNIISQCDIAVQKRFTAIGGFVASIFAFCFVSSYFTFTKLFQNYFIGIPIGMFFEWMITNIYLLLLYTLSKNSFPNTAPKGAKRFSILIRITFICFIAIVISKPIETLLYAIPLEASINKYKAEQIAKYSQATAEYFQNETENINIILAKEKEYVEKGKISGQSYYQKLLERRRREKEQSMQSMVTLVSHSNYYIKSIAILSSEHKSCWLVTLVIMVVFLFPAYLKNYLGEQSFYYEEKKKIEKSIVLDEYHLFKGRYTTIMKDKLGVSAEFSEPFLDPPFNTVRKKDERVFLKEDELIAEIYNG